MDALVDAVLFFNELPEQHPNERDEFFLHIHGCQGLLAARVMGRLYPEVWVNHAAAE